MRASDLVRTLSPNNPHDYSVIQGFLYAPTLPPSSPCDNATRALIPSNVTTLADLPYGHSSLIALAPWTEPACVQSYLSVMASDGVRGAIFFHPGNDSQQPPPVSDPSWSLNDGGQWKSTNQYPVYAIPGSLGAFLLHELALYSGNMSQAPFGEELVTIYDPHDTVRLYGRLDINTAGGIPSLWIFLIIVLAILLSVVLTTSVIMHWIQRKQRQRLQQRVANGEVDLEVLGIKRLKVPQDILDTMPQYPYTLPTQVGNDEKSTAGKVAEPEDKDHANGAASDAGHEVAFHQPTCPICLDDFVAGETTVRELPCKHIYHPECIDPFLRDSSSLCPMCKKTTLPAGYCPVQVTNIMVRRERLIRRMRQRNAPEGAPGSNGNRFPATLSGLGRRVRRLSVPLAAGPRPYGSYGGQHGEWSELQSISARRGFQADPEVPAQVRAQGVSATRAWRREEVARQQATAYDQQADETRAADVSRPLCKSFPLSAPDIC